MGRVHPPLAHRRQMLRTTSASLRSLCYMVCLAFSFLSMENAVLFMPLNPRWLVSSQICPYSAAKSSHPLSLRVSCASANCLTGYTQSGTSFHAKTKALEKALSKAFPAVPENDPNPSRQHARPPGSLAEFPGGVQLIYPTAPHR